MSHTDTKPYDIIIFGASGFMGQLVVRYFIARTNESAPLRWAVAGRSRDTLIRALTSLEGMTEQRLENIPMIIVDAHDSASLTAMVRSTRVVASTVNPYMLHGSLLVETCVENGVDYCDVTGETLWVSRMIERFDARAKETGARIVPCCGFDAVVADLAAFELASLASTTDPSNSSSCSAIKFFLTGSRGGFSGGSFMSAISHVSEARRTKDGWKSLGDPFLFCPGRNVKSSRNEDSWFPQKERELGKARSSAFFGAVVNKPVVYRSNILLNELYGCHGSFQYHHRIAMGGLVAQWGLSLSMWWLGAMLYTRVGRSLLKLMAPRRGSGPSESVMQSGSFSASAFALDNQGKVLARAELAGVGDPGFLLTSKILAECAACLASSKPESAPGGFLTPASAFGHELTQSLVSHHVLSIQVVEQEQEQE